MILENDRVVEQNCHKAKSLETRSADKIIAWAEFPRPFGPKPPSNPTGTRAAIFPALRAFPAGDVLATGHILFSRISYLSLLAGSPSFS